MTQTTEHPEKQQVIGTSQRLALIAIILGTFTAVLGNSLLNVALPQLVSVFGSTPGDIQWVVTGYMLASAVVIPMSGFLGDKYGYKKLFLMSVLTFTLFSLLSGFAWSDASLIIFRILQGLGGGFIMPVGMAIIYMIFPREKIPLVLGIWGIAAMAAPAVGPTLSGYLMDLFSWRILFFLNVPVGAIALIIGFLMLKETPKKEDLKFDVSGIVLSVIFFGTLLLALSKGQSEGWTSFFVVTLLFVSFFSLLLFIWVETGTDHPVMDLKLFANKTFIISTISSGFVMIAMMGGLYLMPIYLQNIQGMTPTQTGLLLMPQSIAMAIMMPVSGKLQARTGAIPLAAVGLIVVAVTTFELHRLSADSSHAWINWILTIRGIGIGLCLNPLNTHGMNAVPRDSVGNASSISNVTRTVMGSMGIAVITSIMTNRQVIYGAKIAESIPADSIAFTSFQGGIAHRLAEVSAELSSAGTVALGLLSGLVQKEALVRAIGDTFAYSAVPAVISFILLMLIRQTKIVRDRRFFPIKKKRGGKS